MKKIYSIILAFSLLHSENLKPIHFNELTIVATCSVYLALYGLYSLVRIKPWQTKSVKLDDKSEELDNNAQHFKQLLEKMIGSKIFKDGDKWRTHRQIKFGRLVSDDGKQWQKINGIDLDIVCDDFIRFNSFIYSANKISLYFDKGIPHEPVICVQNLKFDKTNSTHNNIIYTTSVTVD